jgi:hypothetical protein
VTRRQTTLIELEGASEELATASSSARRERAKVTLWVCHLYLNSAADWIKVGKTIEANENLDRAREFLGPLRTRASRLALARLEAIGRLPNQL